MSNYPKEIDNFVEKLNKLDNNTYVIEEEIITSNGVYEAELQHDNVNKKQLMFIQELSFQEINLKPILFQHHP